MMMVGWNGDEAEMQVCWFGDCGDCGDCDEEEEGWSCWYSWIEYLLEDCSREVKG